MSRSRIEAIGCRLLSKAIDKYAEYRTNRSLGEIATQRGILKFEDRVRFKREAWQQLRPFYNELRRIVREEPELAREVRELANLRKNLHTKDEL